jgi:hypothetical protein
MDRSSWVGGNSDIRLEHSCMHQRPQRPRRERRRMGMHHEGEKAAGRQSLVVQSRIHLLCLPFLYFPSVPSGGDDAGGGMEPRLPAALSGHLVPLYGTRSTATVSQFRWWPPLSISNDGGLLPLLASSSPSPPLAGVS